MCETPGLTKERDCMYDRYDCRIFCFVGYSNFAFTFLAELLSEQYPCSVSQKLYTFLLLDLFRLRLLARGDERVMMITMSPDESTLLAHTQKEGIHIWKPDCHR
ncbi:hypothetical protein BU26DRAFT_245245 [Trematosphaeria pertusa]|uniref:Uncharacterized protein n=1 Tax=Trematosphaeria pertusa TaxID=390896 RepID=A0A6A6IQM4_9PLEO|nr:uncharacterized protein BU26DRAFT_245245 [Trematosphaeria pertusa]KAF2251823.1 hypothetical protein BU26DRAFT_245245 [Trematosphaeria pertusa]